MFKRNLVPYLIRACKQQHLIKLIVSIDIHRRFSKLYTPNNKLPKMPTLSLNRAVSSATVLQVPLKSHS